MCGTYEGTGESKLEINLGFRPAAVLVEAYFGYRGHDRSSSGYSSSSWGGLAVGTFGAGTTDSQYQTALEITDSGFWVSSLLNDKTGPDIPYRYIAFR